MANGEGLHNTVDRINAIARRPVTASVRKYPTLLYSSKAGILAEVLQVAHKAAKTRETRGFPALQENMTQKQCAIANFDVLIPNLEVTFLYPKRVGWKRQDRGMMHRQACSNA